MWSKLFLAALGALATVNPAAAAPTGACTCNGGVVNGKCYNTLADAFHAVNPGGTIEIGGKVVLTKQIFFSKSVNLEGIECDGEKPVISGNMNAGEGGMLEARGPDRLQIRIRNIAFTREPKSGPVAAFRGGVLEENTGEGAKKCTEKDAPVIDLTVRKCEFYGLLTKARGGSAVYVLVPGNIDIDAGTIFRDNTVARPSSARWGGGGALWLVDFKPACVRNIDAVFRNNEGLFEHGNGGAVVLEKVRGTVNVGGKFFNNRASDGGALHVARVQGSGRLYVNAHFEDNEAVEHGWGSRAGAVRLQYQVGTAVIDGTFINNRAPQGRGGAIATNRLYSGAHLTIKGTYKNNLAGTSGGVFDQIKGSGQYQYSYVFEKGASLTVDGSAKFSGNVAETKAKSNILNIAPLGVTLSEVQWEGKTVVYHGMDEPLEKDDE